MLFLDPWFWIFASIAVPGYWATPPRLKLYWLIAVSAVFHWYFAGPAGMLPILILAVLTYAVGRRLEAPRDGRLFGLMVLLLVAALGFYKYSEFALDSLAGLFDAMGLARADEWAKSWSSPAAPLAISFFTFEFVHYLYEVRVKGRPAIRNPAHFALFAIFFPTLASGPIKRFPDFVPQLSSLHNPSQQEVWAAVRRIIRGLFKKICIADLLVEYIAVLEQAPVYTAPLVGVLAVLQGFRIYYDFAGYSDIAIGFSNLVALRVPENFDRPYFSTSLQEFWRRWHMSLSTWIRDYVYIPLGGNRARQALNVLLAMALCGLWHGAAWNFVLWGAYHGLGLGIESALRARWPSVFRAAGITRALRWAVCYAYVSYGWLLFFYPLSKVVQMSLGALGWTYEP